MDLTVLNYDNIPGMDIVQHLGQKLLGVAFIFLLAREAYRHVKGEGFDFGGPLLRVGLGFFIISYLPQISLFISDIVIAAVGGMKEQNNLELFVNAVRKAMKQTSCKTSWFSLFSMSTLIHALILIFLVLMWVAKFLIIDVIWPVMFALSIYSGALSVPLAVFPGSEGIQGWLREVISVAIWPLVFQLLIALMAASFPFTLSAMADGTVLNYCTISAKDGAANLTSTTGALHFLGICIAFVGLLFWTPSLSGKIVRSNTVTTIGGVMANQAKTVATFLAVKTALGGKNLLSKQLLGKAWPKQTKSAADQINQRV